METLPATLQAIDERALRRALLSWYGRVARDLPWRDGVDGWGVLVSEIMLQQTTVSAVVPYYQRFMARWPRPEDLACCDDDELSAAWAGLGYYRRARMLKQAAQRIAEGGMPNQRDGLRALPGVGEYTSAAVASIAFGQPEAVLDGNVERVLCRLLAWDGDPRRAAGRRLLRQVADGLLARRRPGDFNQALMELGATLCRPRAPACERCPLRIFCAACSQGQPERYPRLPPRRASVSVTCVVALAERRGRVLLVRRRQDPNRDFFELPGCELPPGDGDAQHGRPADGSHAAPRDARNGRTVGTSPLEPRAAGTLAGHLLAAHGLSIERLQPLPPHRHSITHHHILLLPHRVLGLSGRARGGPRWLHPGAEQLPLTTATRRVLARSAPQLLEARS